jgi:hypothetical protein
VWIAGDVGSDLDIDGIDVDQFVRDLQLPVAAAGQ